MKFALASTSFLLATVPFARADWPEYRGPSHDGQSTEKIARSWPGTGPRQLWKIPSPGGFSSFVVAGGRCFTLVLRDVDGAGREMLTALDADTGKELWAAAIGVAKYDGGGDAGAEGNQGGDGPRSTPAVDGGRVYTLSGRLVLQCFDAKSGQTLWTRDLVKEHGGPNIRWQNAQSPVIDGDLLFVAGGGPGESLLAFNKRDGSIVWKGFDEKMTHATAVPATILGQRQVVFFVQSGLLSVDGRTGKELWRYAHPFKTSTAASPVIDGDTVYCSAGYTVGGSAARIARSGEAWTATRLYFKEGNKPLANHWSTPVLKDGHLYGMFQFKEFAKGPLKCVDIRTGDVKWEQPGFGPGNVILVGDQVLALSDDGQLVLIEATPAGYKENGRADVLDGKCWTTPVVSGGRVFARSTKEAVCLDVRPAAASQ
ncbi:MAG: alcohol dehydrogenase [Pedosphaera sp.]|nr:alcohol dehydrogenase [Pedosphaera sp.]